MKKFLRVFAVLLLTSGLLLGSASAAYYVDIRPNGPIAAAPGDPFSVEVYLVGDSSDNLKSYTCDIAFDFVELEYVSATEYWPTAPYNPDTMMYAPIATLKYDDPTKTIQNIDGYPIPYGASGTTLAKDELLATIDFTVVAPLSDGAADVWVHYRTGQGFNINDEIVFPTSEGHEPSIVPIPGALWLLGSGLLGLVGVRRYRRN